MTVPPPPPALPASLQQARGPMACYRHTGRGTAISCSRCGRPICPDCMNDAPVGFQCPECIKEGRASAPRSVFGAQMVGRQGIVTYVLVAANVLVAVLHGWGDADRYDWALVPYQVKGSDQYYRLFSSGFIHFGFVHIAFNMLALISLGPQLEALLGRVRFAALYFVSLAGASALSYLLLPIGVAGGGASGAIYGLLGGMFVVSRRLNIDTRMLNTWIIYGLVFSFFPGTGIDWRAHVGGLVTGAAVTWGMVNAPRKHRAWIQAASVLAGFAVAFAMIAFRTATFPSLS